MTRPFFGTVADQLAVRYVDKPDSGLYISVKFSGGDGTEIESKCCASKFHA